MSDPASNPVSHPHVSMHGEELLDQLRQGWTPLPFRAVVALVLVGLRVRLSRSVVTVVTVVLAITFLTYTGLSGKVNYNLALIATKMSETPGMRISEVREALASVSAADLAEALPGEPASWLDLWLEEPAEKLRGELESLQARPALPGAEKERLTRKLELRTWLDGGDTSWGEAEIAVECRALFTDEGGLRLKEFTNTSVWSDREMEQAEFLHRLAEQVGHPSAAMLGRVIADEKRKRDGARLASLLRRAGINTEATLEGGFMDTWIIIMALLLCTVGIANAMLMSVTERFREIGTMKCLGAQDGLVVKLFLLESALMGIAGALLGIVGGILVALVGAGIQFGIFGLTGFPYVQGLSVVGYALLAGIFLALVGTLYPALLASRMKPVDALRIDE